MGRNARQIFNDLGYTASKEMDPDEADVVWVRQNFEQKMVNLSDAQALNHLPNEECLNNKGVLAQLSKVNPDWKNFLPESYCLYVYDHAKEFFSKPRDGIWIVKPCSESGGVGIKLFRPSQSTAGLQFSSQNNILQKYVENPFLLDGFKSSIRCYWLIAGLNPMRVYLYPEGTVKMCTEKYTTENLNLSGAHLTNTFQNESSKNYEAEANKLSWDDFFARSRTLSQQNVVAQMKSALSNIVATAHDILTRKPAKGHFFGLLGADWVLDQNGKLWLTEVQQSFGMKFDDPLKNRILPPLFDETIQIVSEIVNETTTEPKSVNKFVRIK